MSEGFLRLPALLPGREEGEVLALRALLLTSFDLLMGFSPGVWGAINEPLKFLWRTFWRCRAILGASSWALGLLSRRLWGYGAMCEGYLGYCGYPLKSTTQGSMKSRVSESGLYRECLGIPGCSVDLLSVRIIGGYGAW